jgi:hypothetical protein
MSGGTQVTTTTTQPWEAQEPYLIEGMKKAAGLYEGGEFDPEFYGAPGTQAPGAAAIGQVAPGVAAFDPQQKQAMQRAYQYAMGPVPEAYSGAAARGLMGGPGAPGILPFAQQAMGQGSAMGQPQTQAGYAGMTPFSEDQYGGLLAGNVDTTQFGDVADVYRREAMGQLQEEMLPGIRSKMVGFQPGGGTRGDLLQSKALSSASQRVSDNIAKAMFGAQQQAEAMRLPAAQMGLGAQQFGMGYGMQGMEGARAGLGMAPSLMGAPLGMYGAAQGIGAQQQALSQAALDYDIGRYDYQAQLPQQALGQYLAGVSGDYGGMAKSTGPGGGGGAEAMIAALAAKAIGL